MLSDAGLVTNCCVIAVPGPKDAGRVEALIDQIAGIARGVPVTTPHVTLVYFAQATEAQAVCMGPDLARLSAQFSPLAIQATALLREPAFVPNDPTALILEVNPTPPMDALHERLRRLGQEQCSLLPIYYGEHWRAHITVLDTADPTDDAPDRVNALAAEMHFTAAELVLSYRQDEDTPWSHLGVYPLSD